MEAKPARQTSHNTAAAAAAPIVCIDILNTEWGKKGVKLRQN